MEWLREMISNYYLLSVLSGILGWAWMNYAIYKAKPEEKDEFFKWACFFCALIFGVAFAALVFLLFLFIAVYDRKFYFGLRFK